MRREAVERIHPGHEILARGRGGEGECQRRAPGRGAAHDLAHGPLAEALAEDRVPERVIGDAAFGFERGVEGGRQPGELLLGQKIFEELASGRGRRHSSDFRLSGRRVKP
jgi:hypothetical protein